MDDFISRAETIKMLRALMGASVTGSEQALVEAAVHVAESVPKADVQPVRHGWWLWTRLGYACGEYEYKCSACGETEWRTDCGRLKFCPFCGAKMDLREQDGQ